MRISIRDDLPGFDIAPDTYIRNEEKDRKPIRIHQYSFLAFARFYYNRICASIEGDYKFLPGLRVAAARSSSGFGNAPGESSQKRSLRPVRSTHENTPAQTDRTGSPATTSVLEDTSRLKARSKTRANLMRRLCSAVSPQPNETSRSEILLRCDPEDRSRYEEALGQNARDSALWMAQTTVARMAVGCLKGQE